MQQTHLTQGPSQTAMGGLAHGCQQPSATHAHMPHVCQGSNLTENTLLVWVSICEGERPVMLSCFHSVICSCLGGCSGGRKHLKELTNMQPKQQLWVHIQPVVKAHLPRTLPTFETETSTNAPWKEAWVCKRRPKNSPYERVKLS